jgi:arabinan endo-1,5-alpha-L-arabinosidase
MKKLINVPFLIALLSFSGIVTAQISPPSIPLTGGQQQRRPRPEQNISNNGLKGSLVVHDPVMIKAGDTYYVFTTGMGTKTSKDKINWSSGPAVFPQGTKFSWWNDDIPDRVGLWAPDIHWGDGKYHLYYSVSAWMNFKSSVGYATNVTLDKNDSRYHWEDKGKVIDFKNGGDSVNVIDPNFFADSDGKQYLVYGSYKGGLRLVELNPKTGKPFSDKPELTIITTHLGEGCYIIKGPKYYYVFASRGKCCAGTESTYQIVMGRSKSIKGPYLSKEGKKWTDNDYSVFLAGDYDEPGGGHNGFFAEGDTTYIVYHAYTRAFNGSSLLNIKPLYMDKAGWPTLNPKDKLFAMPVSEKTTFIGK